MNRGTTRGIAFTCEVPCCGPLSPVLGPNKPSDCATFAGLDVASRGDATESRMNGIRLMADRQAIRIVARDRFGWDCIFISFLVPRVLSNSESLLRDSSLTARLLQDLFAKSVISHLH